MPQYKFYYFDVRARGEPIRLLLKYTGLEHEEIKFMWDKWPEIKKTAPLGQCPILEVDGVKISQTNAIMRFLAKRTGLYGDGNDLTEAKIDMYAGGVEDFWMQIEPYYVTRFLRQDPEAAAALLAKANEEKFQARLKIWNEILGNSASGFLVGEKPCYADFLLFNMLDILNHFDKAIVASHENVVKFFDKIANLKGVKEHLATRKHTDG